MTWGWCVSDVDWGFCLRLLWLRRISRKFFAVSFKLWRQLIGFQDWKPQRHITDTTCKQVEIWNWMLWPRFHVNLFHLGDENLCKQFLGPKVLRALSRGSIFAALESTPGNELTIWECQFQIGKLRQFSEKKTRKCAIFFYAKRYYTFAQPTLFAGERFESTLFSFSLTHTRATRIFPSVLLCSSHGGIFQFSRTGISNF